MRLSFLSNRVLLAIIFGLAAGLILFWEIILKFIAVFIIALIGWMVGSVLDDRPLINRLRYQIRNAFSRRNR